LDDARIHQTCRRSFLARSSALAAASLLGVPRIASAEPPPEKTKIRLLHFPAICLAPQYLAEAFLRMEGFTEIEYVSDWAAGPPSQSVVENRVDFTVDTAPSLVPPIDSGGSVVTLLGVHAGCYELFAYEHVQGIRDLKGKTISIPDFGWPDHMLMASMLAYVGIDPNKDVNWIKAPWGTAAMTVYLERKADAYFAFAPQGEELRAKKAGRAIVNTALDRPWSQYFCCMIVGQRDFIARHPVATKRALRAILRASDICSQDPEQAARFMVEKGYAPRYDVALEYLKGLPYDRWRTDNPADTLRFYSLRLRDAGMIKSTPQQIIERGSNFSFLNELKRELRA